MFVEVDPRNTHWFGVPLPTLHVMPLLLGLLLLIQSSNLFGQAAMVRIPGDITCPQCTVEIAVQAKLPIPTDTRLVYPAISVSRDGRGGYYLTGVRDDPFVMHFGPDGRTLRRFGRRGQGPGEYDEPALVMVDPTDSVWVIDRGLRRITIYDSTLRFARTFTIAEINVASGLMLPDGTLLLTGVANTSTGIGHPFHSVSRDGRWIHSFGGQGIAVAPDRLVDQMRGLAMTTRHDLWISHTNRYVLEHRAAGGELLTTLAIESEWFKPWRTNRFPIYGMPEPTLVGVSTDASGIVWAFIVVAAESYRPRPQPSEGSGGVRREERSFSFDEAFANYDTIVQAIDPQGKRVLASRRLRGPVFVTPGSPSTLARLQTAPSGEQHFEVFVPRLTRSR